MKIIDIPEFYSDYLKNERTLRVCLPDSYETALDRCYPVLYMHDGQNVFTPEYSYSGASWELHTTVSSLTNSQQMEEIIIVAVDNHGEDRLSEYAFAEGFYNGEVVPANGPAYAQFLVEEVKSYIDQHYRTLKDYQNTALMGSSMGGLVTFHIGLMYPGVFGKLGVVSPSFWWGNAFTLAILDRLSEEDYPLQMWIDMGDQEDFMMAHCDEAVRKIAQKMKNPERDMVYYKVPGGIHSEVDWAERVHCPLLYFFGNIGNPEKISIHNPSSIGIEGTRETLNPVVTFDSGFAMTVLGAEIHVEDQDILTVYNGEILPHNVGSTTVHVSWESFSESCWIDVSEYNL